MMKPVPGERNVLVTSALPYVNNVPHLGNIVGCVLSADVFARFCRQKGYNTLYICGTDEYGTATETKAIAEGLTPQEICDKYHKIHKEVYEWFDIAFDHFGRTSTPQQTECCQDIFLKVKNNGFIYEDAVEQLFCEKCQKSLADRFVEGTCPLCGYEDARGDQCDGCGQLLNASDLLKPKCKICSETPVVKSTKHLFLDLSKIEDKLSAFVDERSVAGDWSSNAVQVTRSWLKTGLKGRCITRDLKWGTPVPVEEFKDKVFYVWFDAPIGYISITKCLSDEWEIWWKNPDHVHLYQFMGKDNIPFHTVMFPSSLLASGDRWTMLHHLNSTEYLNYEDGKFSKSRNVGVFGDQCRETGILPEVWRYYLMCNRPEVSDTSFSWDDFATKNNTELLANLGNFIQRSLAFTYATFERKIPALGSFTPTDDALIAKVNEQLVAYDRALESVHLKEGVKIIMTISRLGNQYLQENKPWELKTVDRPRCETVIRLCAELAHLIAAVAQPYMPGLTATILTTLNLSCDPALPLATAWSPDALQEGHEIRKPEPIFKKIDADMVKKYRSKYGGAANREVFEPLIKVGKVVAVSDHPTAEKLFVLEVDVGEAKPRQVCAGIKAHYKQEELLNRKVALLVNLLPAELKGVKSEGMVLVAVGKRGLTGLLGFDSDVPVGAVFTAEDVNNTPRTKKPFDLKEFQGLKLKVNDHGHMMWKDHAVSVAVEGSAVVVVADKKITKANVK